MPPRRSHRTGASQAAAAEQDEDNHKTMEEDVTITNGSRSPRAR